MSDTDATRARQNVVADVDEILEHVINANMLSMPYDVYSELFDAVDGLGVKVEKTEAENAKLREENVRFIIKLNVEHIVRQNVESENAKLRELAHILCHCMQINANCDDCRLNGAKGEIAHDQLAACDSLHELLRELGIEVDG